MHPYFCQLGFNRILMVDQLGLELVAVESCGRNELKYSATPHDKSMVYGGLGVDVYGATRDAGGDGVIDGASARRVLLEPSPDTHLSAIVKHMRDKGTLFDNVLDASQHLARDPTAPAWILACESLCAPQLMRWDISHIKHTRCIYFARGPNYFDTYISCDRYYLADMRDASLTVSMTIPVSMCPEISGNLIESSHLMYFFKNYFACYSMLTLGIFGSLIRHESGHSIKPYYVVF